MMYLWTAVAIAVGVFVAGIGVHDDGPSREFFEDWLLITAVMCAVALPVLAVAT